MGIDTYAITSVATNPTASVGIPPTTPLFGAFMDWTASANAAAGWVEVPFEFSEDDFDFAEVDQNPLIVKPPAREVKTEKIRNAQGVESIGFTAYEIGAKCYEQATNGSYQDVGRTRIFTFSKTHTRAAVCVEFGKIGLLYFPSCEIQFEAPRGGVWRLGTQVGMIDVFGTDAITAGFQWVQFRTSSS